MVRNQLPTGIRKLELTSRRDGRIRVRYEVLVPTGTINGHRKHIRRRFKTESEARKELAETQAKVRTGVYVHTSKTTVETACADWLASKHGIKPSTQRGYKVWLAPLRQELGTVQLQKLTKADLDRLIGRLRLGDVPGSGKWAARSVNGLLGLLTAIIEDKMKQGHVVRNVARLVDRLASEKQEMKTLSEADMFKILDYPDRDRHLWTLALYGLRRGEIAGLRWENVNFETKTISIFENRVVVGRTIVAGTPKSQRSRRVLPMPDEVFDVLQDARDRIESEYVACDDQGNVMHPNLLTFRWGRMLDKLKIERVRLHDARHSCGSLMHLRGVPIAIIAAWLGHASSAFTMNTYIHSQDDALVTAAQSYGRVATLSATSAARDTQSEGK